MTQQPSSACQTQSMPDPARWHGPLTRDTVVLLMFLTCQLWNPFHLSQRSCCCGMWLWSTIFMCYSWLKSGRCDVMWCEWCVIILAMGWCARLESLSASLFSVSLYLPAYTTHTLTRLLTPSVSLSLSGCVLVSTLFCCHLLTREQRDDTIRHVAGLVGPKLMGFNACTVIAYDMSKQGCGTWVVAHSVQCKMVVLVRLESRGTAQLKWLYHYISG